MNIEEEFGNYVFDIEYIVQPTDDNDKIYVKTDSNENFIQFAADILSSYLLHDRIEATAAQTRLEEEREKRDQEQALTEQRAAVLQEAKVENGLSVQAVNAVWQALPDFTRSEMVELQKAWAGRKVAECRVEASEVSIDASEKQAARLRCETRMNNERKEWLSNYLGGVDKLAHPQAD